jgi:hypothetical protein
MVALFVLVVEHILLQIAILKITVPLVVMMYIMGQMYQHLQHFLVVVLIQHLILVDLAQLIHIGLLFSQIVMIEHDLFLLIQEMILMDVEWM